MADSSDIDAALLTRLQTDPQLTALLPDGIWQDMAPANCRAFGLVTFSLAEDESTFGTRAIERILYTVKAVILQGSGDIKAAAQRIDDLLESQPLAVAGYSWMTMHRDERVRYTEVDDQDDSIRWRHRGGIYRVEMSLS